MRVYDLLAPVYGVWAALTESKAHARALEISEGCGGRDYLEVAVGTGSELARMAAGRNRRFCIGVDLSFGMLKRAKRKISRPHLASCSLCQADARFLPFRSGSFDCLLNCYMIDLLPERDIQVVLCEFRSVLSPGGLLVLTIMARQSAILERPWMALYRLSPELVGGCRPVAAAAWLEKAGWRIESRELIRQNGFRSEVLAARP